MSLRILVTGAEGFIGKNVIQHLRERKDLVVDTFTRLDDPGILGNRVASADSVIHLAGVNRPQDPEDFKTGNVDLTRQICEAAKLRPDPLRLVMASSIQATRDTPYGLSKRAAEQEVEQAAQRGYVDPWIFRLPNVFGKWCRPNYNSAVATFCHNIVRDLPVTIHDPNAPLSLVYVDDVVGGMMAAAEGGSGTERCDGFCAVSPVHVTTVGGVVEMIRDFHGKRHSLGVADVGQGFARALYATYVSYIPPEEFSYAVKRHADPRGVFVEMLKTPSSGQMSYFTAAPGITRGGHYHHTKSEKFLVIKGTARFRFRALDDGQSHELVVTGDESRIVDTVPGWVHDITNTGSDELIVMLWANEVFDPDRPDTYAAGL